MLETRQLPEATAQTAGMFAMLDDALGEMMQTLRAGGQIDNAVDYLNSDHRDNLGDFDLILRGRYPSVR